MSALRTVRTVYKITRPDLTTFDGYPWMLGRRQTFPGRGPLCSKGWAHVYTSAALAVMMNPIHANYDPFRLWEARGIVGATDHGLKLGCSSLTLIREIIVPEIPPEARVAFGLWCALAVYSEPHFVTWAEGWLAGHDRSARAAARARFRATEMAANVMSAWSAAFAAERATQSAEDVAWGAADAALSAAFAAERATQSAEDVAWGAAVQGTAIDLDALAAAALLPVVL